MKRQGSILILVLLVFLVVLMGALYILHSSTMHMYIARNNSINNQGFYTSEGKINMCIYEDKYYNIQLYPIIFNEFRNNNLSIKDYVLLYNEDLDTHDTIKKVDVSFEIIQNRKCMKLVSQSKQDNILSSASSFYTIINEIFEWGIPILHGDYLDNIQNDKIIDYISELDKNIIMPKLPTNVNGINSYDCDSVTINSINFKNLEVVYIREDKVIKTDRIITPYKVNDLIIVISDLYGKGTNLSINNSEKATKFDGVIYIEGDLIIKNEFIFNGIIIINNGKIVVNTDINPIINGIIIGNGEEDWIDLSRVNVTYDFIPIHHYGTYLPDFLKTEFLMTKKGKIGDTK